MYVLPCAHVLAKRLEPDCAAPFSAHVFGHAQGSGYLEYEALVAQLMSPSDFAFYKGYVDYSQVGHWAGRWGGRPVGARTAWRERL